MESGVGMETTAHKPLYITGNHPQRACFQIVECGKDITRQQLKTFFENLPMRFTLKDKKTGEESNQPLEVYISSKCSIIRVYPPNGTVLSGASFQAWEFFSVTSKMRVDNIMDDCNTTKNIRSCIHFHTTILGVNGWPKDGNKKDRDVELDIFKYPKG